MRHPLVLISAFALQEKCHQHQMRTVEHCNMQRRSLTELYKIRSRRQYKTYSHLHTAPKWL